MKKEVAREVTAGHFTCAALEEHDVDLKKLQGWLEKIRLLDFYGANLAADARGLLRECKAVLDACAQRVFDSHDKNRPA